MIASKAVEIVLPYHLCHMAPTESNDPILDGFNTFIGGGKKPFGKICLRLLRYFPQQDSSMHFTILVTVMLLLEKTPFRLGNNSLHFSDPLYPLTA